MSLIQTPNIHSLSDFQRHTSRHVQHLRETGLPEVLTIKGRAELVVQSAEAYQALLTKLELHESAAAIQRGLLEIREGDGMELDAFDQTMRAKMQGRSEGS